MALRVAALWRAPDVNPINGKARSIPCLNPFNIYGRVFFFSWWAFLVAFWSWYAFPPLMTVTIKEDLQLSETDVANSNIIALVATLGVRAVAGPACDRFGPRLVFVACLFLGAVPTALAGTVTDARGLMAVRFFVGILGGTFVPCQVWSTGFFDTNIVGLANALAAGLGNAGGGVTYFVMPAIFDSLVRRHGLAPRTAWRVAFVVPFTLIVAAALLILRLCPDTPTGPWAARDAAVQHNLAVFGSSQAAAAPLSAEQLSPSALPPTPPSSAAVDEEATAATAVAAASTKHYAITTPIERTESAATRQRQLDKLAQNAEGEVVKKPTLRAARRVVLSLPTLALCACYACTFGGELAINSFLGAYYLAAFPRLGQTGSSNWAAMFGLLNAVFRPLGGYMSDRLYRWSESLWSKKLLIHVLGLFTAAFLLLIGIVDRRDSLPFTVGLVAGMAFFLEASNGAIFSLVPHVHPSANGIVSGLCGAFGNLGGVLFAVLSRYTTTTVSLPPTTGNGDGGAAVVVRPDYARIFTSLGVFTASVNVLLLALPPIPKRQIGVR